VEFEWDRKKAESNLIKHGVAFEDATEIFDDPNEITDNGKMINGELRFQIIGRLRQTVLLVVFTLRQGADGEVHRRLISARRASRQERAIYEQT